MKSFEGAKAIAETSENAMETGHWNVQVWENHELGCFEAFFVIKLDGIDLSASDKGTPVSPTNADGRDEPTFQKSQEQHL